MTFFHWVYTYEFFIEIETDAEVCGCVDRPSWVGYHASRPLKRMSVSYVQVKATVLFPVLANGEGTACSTFAMLQAGPDLRALLKKYSAHPL